MDRRDFSFDRPLGPDARSNFVSNVLNTCNKVTRIAPHKMIPAVAVRMLSIVEASEPMTATNAGMAKTR